MAGVPSSGTLEMIKIARERRWANYSGNGLITAPISMYNLILGGNTGGAVNSGIRIYHLTQVHQQYYQAQDLEINLGDLVIFTVTNRLQLGLHLIMFLVVVVDLMALVIVLYQQVLIIILD